MNGKKMLGKKIVRGILRFSFASFAPSREPFVFLFLTDELMMPGCAFDRRVFRQFDYNSREKQIFILESDRHGQANCFDSKGAIGDGVCRSSIFCL